MKMFFSVLLFLLVATFQKSIAQNYSDVKVDDLTDTQVKQLMQRASSMGYDDAQLEQLAAAQGMNAAEIQKLRLRVEKIRSKDGQAAGSNIKKDAQDQDTENSIDRSRSSSITNRDSTLKNSVDIFEDLKPKVFGRGLFSTAGLTFEPNLRLATPKGYVIGPDDELLIDLSGDNEASYRLKVSPDGNIRLQYVGNISVGGLTIEQAISKIKSNLAPTYPSIKSGRTTVAVNLGNIRTIKVTIVGEVVKPGSYSMSSLSTVFNALNAAGGPNDNGSFRNIQVVRGNQVVSVIDIYDFLLKGTQKKNVRLQDQDVINIPVYKKRVEVSGQVKRPALFELLDGESLEDVIGFAGGFSTEAYSSSIKILQNTNKDRKIIDVQSTQFNSYNPKSGDKILVDKILDRFSNKVEIEGAVFRPGIYSLEDGATLKGLITKAEGLKEDAFLNRGYINRLNSNNTLNLISFDVSKIMSGVEGDISLKREDKVVISSLFDLRDEYTISIQGEVRAPGTFDYADNTSVESLIQMAGGFKEGASPSRIEVSRRVQNLDSTGNNVLAAQLFTLSVDKSLKIEGPTFVLQPFDVVSIRSSDTYFVQKQVKLEGEVRYPGFYTITTKNERISDLINRAGGLTDYAYSAGASLKRPGAEKVNPTDKNAIDNKDENERKYLNLKRAQESGVKDTLSAEVEQMIIQSDLVGINLVRILEKPKSRFDILVEDGDVIRVPRVLQTVKITGEVLNPNSIIYLSGTGMRQYINGAGGFTSNARKGGTYIKYANGSVASVSKFLFFNNYPQVKPGAEILVPKRAERERISAQAWIGIGTGLASLGAVIVSLLR